MQPWDRQPGEPELWYARFEAFRRAGSTRSVLGVYRAELEQSTRSGPGKAGKGPTPNDAPGAWKKNATTWRWRERAEVWDAHQREEQRAADALALDEARETWKGEKAELKGLLIKKIRSMLSFPLQTVTTERMESEAGGGIVQVTTIVHPVGWRLRDVAVLVRSVHTLMEVSPQTDDEIDSEIEKLLAELGQGGKEEAP